MLPRLEIVLWPFSWVKDSITSQLTRWLDPRLQYSRTFPTRITSKASGHTSTSVISRTPKPLLVGWDSTRPPKMVKTLSVECKSQTSDINLWTHMPHSQWEDNSITKVPTVKWDPCKWSWVMVLSSLMRRPYWLLQFYLSLNLRKKNQSKSLERMFRL